MEMVLPPSTSPSDELLSRIATLLFILVAALLTVFGYYATLSWRLLLLRHFSF